MYLCGPLKYPMTSLYSSVPISIRGADGRSVRKAEGQGGTERD